MVGRFRGMLYLSNSTRKAFWRTIQRTNYFPLVHWLSITPISSKDQSRIHQFGKKVSPGLFHGCALHAGREFGRVGILVADIEELESMDASEIYSKRLNAKEVIFPKENGKFIFQSQMDD